jgi:GNAT superfamily N-acetyltransferase
MDNVQIATASRAELQEAACVMAEAFAGEGIHRFLFDFSHRLTRVGLRGSLRVELDSAVAAGGRVLMARVDGRIVGGAMICGNAPRPVGMRAAQGFRWLCAAAPLLPAVRWSRLPALRAAISLTRPIVGDHYVLSALAVHPDFHGTGIGSALLEEVHTLVERDPEVVGVYLFTGDRKNNLMYERAGYTTIETRTADALTVYHMFRTNGGHVAPGDVNA